MLKKSTWQKTFSFLPYEQIINQQNKKDVQIIICTFIFSSNKKIFPFLIFIKDFNKYFTITFIAALYTRHYNKSSKSSKKKNFLRIEKYLPKLFTRLRNEMFNSRILGRKWQSWPCISYDTIILKFKSLFNNKIVNYHRKKMWRPFIQERIRSVLLIFAV